MIAMAVNSLLCDAMRNFVAGVIGTFALTSAKPKPDGPDELLVAHHADGDAGEPSIRDLPLDPRGKEALGAEDVGIVRDARPAGLRGRGLRRQHTWSDRSNDQRRQRGDGEQSRAHGGSRGRGCGNRRVNRGQRQGRVDS